MDALEGHVGARQHLAHPQDHGHRRPQLVRHQAEELVLDGEGRAQLDLVGQKPGVALSEHDLDPLLLADVRGRAGHPDRALAVEFDESGVAIQRSEPSACWTRMSSRIVRGPVGSSARMTASTYRSRSSGWIIVVSAVSSDRIRPAAGRTARASVGPARSVLRCMPDERAHLGRVEREPKATAALPQLGQHLLAFGHVGDVPSEPVPAQRDDQPVVDRAAVMRPMDDVLDVSASTSDSRRSIQPGRRSRRGPPPRHRSRRRPGSSRGSGPRGPGHRHRAPAPR